MCCGFFDSGWRNAGATLFREMYLMLTLDMILDAQKDARVQLRQIEWRTQGKDHPILPAAPETQYLKCAIYQVFKG